jgi:hypothetical protein
LILDFPNKEKSKSNKILTKLKEAITKEIKTFSKKKKEIKTPAKLKFVHLYCNFISFSILSIFSFQFLIILLHQLIFL